MILSKSEPSSLFLTDSDFIDAAVLMHIAHLIVAAAAAVCCCS